MPEWWNRQTQGILNPSVEIPCRFKSGLGHQDRQSLNLKYVFVNGVAGFVAKR